MTRNFKHKGLKTYWIKGNSSGLNAKYIARISRILGALDASTKPEDMNLPGYHFHALSGSGTGRYSIRVTGNYRVTFAWSNQDAINVNLEDYH